MNDNNPKATVNAKTDMSSEFDFSNYGMEKLPQPVAPNLEVSAVDGLRGLTKGAVDGAQGLTELIEQGGKAIDNAADGDGVGSYVAKAYQYNPLVMGATKAAELWTDALGTASDWIEGTMSDDAQAALSAPVASKNDDGSWAISDDPAVWGMQISQSLGYMAPTAAAAIATGGTASTAAAARLLPKATELAIKMGAKPEVAAKAAQLAIQTLKAAPVVGAGMGADLGAQGVQAREGIMNADLGQLVNSDTFRNEFLAVDTNPEYAHLSDAEKIDIARENVADMASRATSTDPKNVAASVLATALGDVPLVNAILKGGKGAASKMGSAAALGFLREGSTEALQEGTQQFVANEVSNQYGGTELDPMDGVAEAAVSGGLLGAATGGGMGVAGSLRSTTQPQSDSEQESSTNVVQEPQEGTPVDVSASANVGPVAESDSSEQGSTNVVHEQPQEPAQEGTPVDVSASQHTGPVEPNPADFGLTAEQAEMLTDPDPELMSLKPVKKGTTPTAEQLKLQQQADAYKREIKALENSEAGKAYFQAESNYRYALSQSSLRQVTAPETAPVQDAVTTATAAEQPAEPGQQSAPLSERKRSTNVLQSDGSEQGQQPLSDFDASLDAEIAEFERRGNQRKTDKSAEYGQQLEQGRQNVKTAKDNAYLQQHHDRRYGADYQPTKVAQSIRDSLGIDQQELAARDRGDVASRKAVTPAEPAIDAVQAQVTDAERQRNLDHTSAQAQKIEQEDREAPLRKTGNSDFVNRSSRMKLLEQGKTPIQDLDLEARAEKVKKRLNKKLSKLRKANPPAADAVLDEYRNHEKRLAAYAESARQRAEAEAKKPENIARRKSVEALFQEQMAAPEAKTFRRNAIAEAMTGIDYAAQQHMDTLSQAEQADAKAEIEAVKQSARTSLNQLASQLQGRKGKLRQKMIDNHSKPESEKGSDEKGSTNVVQDDRSEREGNAAPVLRGVEHLGLKDITEMSKAGYKMLYAFGNQTVDFTELSKYEGKEGYVTIEAEYSSSGATAYSLWEKPEKSTDLDEESTSTVVQNEVGTEASSSKDSEQSRPAINVRDNSLFKAVLKKNEHEYSFKAMPEHAQDHYVLQAAAKNAIDVARNDVNEGSEYKVSDEGNEILHSLLQQAISPRPRAKHLQPAYDALLNEFKTEFSPSFVKGKWGDTIEFELGGTTVRGRANQTSFTATHFELPGTDGQTFRETFKRMVQLRSKAGQADSSEKSSSTVVQKRPEKQEKQPESNDAESSLDTARRVIREVYDANNGSLKGVRNAYKAAGITAKEIDNAVKRSGEASSVSAFERLVKNELAEKGSSNVVPIDSAAKAKPDNQSKLDNAGAKVSEAKKAAALKLKALLDKKKGTVNSGIDPEIMLAVAEVGALSVADGAIKFSQWVRDVIQTTRTVGIDDKEVEGFLKESYAAISANPDKYGVSDEQADLMDSPRTLRKVDVADLIENNDSNPDPDGPKGSKLDSKRQSKETGNDRATDATRTHERSERAQSEVSAHEPGAAESRNAADGETGNQSDPETGTERDAPGNGQERSVPGDFTTRLDLDSVPDIASGTDKTRVDANLAAIRLMKQLTDTGAVATLEQKQTLAKYVGWGGLAFVFDPNSTRKYAKAADAELRKLLSDTEYNQIRESTRNAFYTDKEVVKAMWAGVQAFGLGNKAMNVVEPSLGSGNFIGWQPEAMRDASRWSAAELDTVTGNIAKLIYPEANIQVKGFQEAPFKHGAFSLAIGNPPFGSQPITDTKNDDISGMSVHNYMIAKSGKLLHDNGLMMMVVTNRFLDTKNKNHRELSKSLDFIGAVRLPNTAFKSNAGTEVTTDIVVFKKLAEGQKASNTVWTDVDGEVNGVRINKWFEQNPGYILGEVSNQGTMYARDGSELTVNPTDEHADLGQSITRALSQLAENHDLAMTDEQVDRLAGEVMLEESDLSLGGMMVDADGNVRRRMEDRPDGSAQVHTVSADTIWSEDGMLLSQIEHFLADKERLQALIADKLVGKTKKLRSEFTAAKYKRVAFQAAIDFAAGKESLANTRDLIASAIDQTRLGEKRFSQVKAMLELRNTTLELLRAEKQDRPDIESLRQKLNEQYDAFVRDNSTRGKRGKTATISGYLNLLNGDLGIESGLDDVSAKGKVKKHDIFTKRMVYPYKAPVSAENVDDAVNYSIQEKGRVNVSYIAKLLGVSKLEARQKLTAGERPYLLTDPETGNDVFIDDYLSGNVKRKYEAARNAGLEINERLLKSVLPKDKPKSKIKPSIRASWMDAPIFEGFLGALGLDAKVSVNPKIGSIRIKGVVKQVADTELAAQFKHDRATLMSLFEAAAAGKSLVIYDRDGKEARKNNKATKEVNALANKMAKAFQTWAANDAEIHDRIASNFNDRINTHVERIYNGRLYLKTVGQSPTISLRKTQLDGALRMIQSMNTLLDHTVGAGKTFTAITGVMQRKRLGLSKKPMIVVPNHIIGAFKSDFFTLYPGANVLAVSEKDFSARNRKRFFSKIATGNYDAIIIGHSHLRFMPNDMAMFEAVINEKIRELRDALEKAKAEAKESGKRGASVKQIEDSIARLKDKITAKKEALKEGGDNVGFDFSDLGVDYLVVDEAHEFKNLTYSTRSDRVVGMNDPKGSEKALDLLIKTRSIQALANGGVTFMTGTPISNSLVEIYTMMYYLGYDDLVEKNISFYDAFAGGFINTEIAMEYTPTGTVKERRVLKGLNNMQELSTLYRQFGDVITQSDMVSIYAEDVAERNAATGENKSTRFPIPNVKGGRRQLNIAPATASQREYNDYLIARMEGIESIGGREERQQYAKIDNPLWVLTDAKKASLDVRLVDPTAGRDPTGKIARAATEIKRLYDTWQDDKGTQLVFSDMGTPAKYAKGSTKKDLVALAASVMPAKRARELVNQRLDFYEDANPHGRTLVEIEDYINQAVEAGELDGEQTEAIQDKIVELGASTLTADTGFSVYDDLKAALAEQGIPEYEIAFIHDYGTVDRKAALFDMVNNGEIRVLIGSSAKMGAGTNAQERLVGLHHMDAPWRSSDMEQREGRIIRQGNSLYQRAADAGRPDDFEVEVLAYATEGSSDPVMWQILERKAGAIEQFRSGSLDEFVENSGGDSDSYAEFKAASTGNPIYKLKLQSDAELLDVESGYMAKASSKGSADRIVNTYEQVVSTLNDQIQAKKSASITAFDVAEFKADREAALVEFNQAVDDYDAAMLEYEELTPAERKAKKIKRPKKPVKRAIYQLDNAYSQQLNADIVQPAVKALQAGQSWQGQLKLGKHLTLAVDSQVKADDAGNEANVTVRYLIDGKDSVMLSSSFATKTFTNSVLLLDALNPTHIERLISYQLKGDRQELRQAKTRYEDAKQLSKLDLKTERQQYVATKARNQWLTTEARMADIKEDLRRGESANKYIDQEGRRKVKRSSFDPSKLDPQSITAHGQTYQTLGVTLPAPSWQYHGVMPALDEKGEYVHLLLSNDSTKEKPVVDSVHSQPSGTPAPEYQFLLDAKEKVDRQATASDEADLAVSFAKRVDGNAPVPGIVDRDQVGFVRGIVDEIISKLDAVDPHIGHSVEIVSSESALPKPLIAAIQRDKAEGQIKGVYYNGTTYLVADKLHDKALVEETLLHEFIGHFGIRKLFEGKPLTQELNRIGLKIGSDKRMLQLAKELGIDLSLYVKTENEAYWRGETKPEERRARLVDELLAHMAGNKQFNSNFNRLVVIIKNWLRQHGFTKLGRYGKAELKALVSEAQKAALGQITPYADRLAKNKKLSKRYQIGYDGDDIRFSRQAFSQPLPGVTLQQVLETQEKSLVTSIKQGLNNIPGLDKMRQNKYGLLTLRQLSEVGHKYLPSIKGYVASVNQMQVTQNLLAEAVADITTEVSDWARQNQEKAEKLFDMMHAATLAGVDPSKPFESLAEVLQEEADRLQRRILATGGDGNVDLTNRRNDILKAIKAEPNRRKEHARLRDKFSKLPADSKQHFISMRDHYTAQRERMREALESSIKRAEMEDAVRKEMLRTVRFDNERAAKELYFPLARFGDYWIDVADENGERQFMMFETQADMEAKKRSLVEAGFNPTSGQKLVESQAVGGASIGFVSDVIGNIKSMKNLGDNYKQQLADDIYQLYLKSMPDRSIRKAFIHRKGVAGFSKDALRAMADQGFKQSRQQARLEHTDDLEGYLEAMRDQSKKSNDVETARIYNEMVKRHEWVNNPQRAPWAQKLTGLGFVWMLGLSPASAMVNLTQNLQVALPILGSKYGMGEASKAMSAATSDFFKALPGHFKKRGHHGIIGSMLKGREHDAMRAAIIAGAIDTTQAADLVGLAENPSAQYNGNWNKAMNVIGWAFHHAEVFNREVTYLAAYRLAYNKSKDHDSAVNEAIKATWDSHFDYGSLNRARFMQGDIAAVAMQFKQYSQNMTYFLFSNLLKSFKKGTPKAERNLARKQLMWTMTTTFAIGGLGALPLSVITLPMMIAQAMFGDDDDPFEPETEIKKMLAEYYGQDVATAMWYGAAPSISQRISLNDLWWRSNDREMAANEWYQNALLQVAGPVIGGIGLSAAWGIKDVSEGYTSRGIEKMTPKAVKDMLKTVRYFNEGGVVSKYGDPVVADLSWSELGAQMIGFTPAEVVKRYDQNSAQKNAEMHVKNRRQALLAAYYMAYRNDDQESMAKVLRKISKYNRSTWGQAYPIKGDHIKKSIRRRVMNLDEMEHGVKLDKRFRQLNDELNYFN